MNINLGNKEDLKKGLAFLVEACELCTEFFLNSPCDNCRMNQVRQEINEKLLVLEECEKENES